MTTDIAPDMWDDAPAAPAYDRQLPQDMDAEQSVLGGMMLSKDAIMDVVEIVTGADFYKPAHETIFDAITTLNAKGEPADPVTVTNLLRERGDLQRVGGINAAYNLVQATPTAANASYYAEIVREKAVLRSLVEAGTKIAALGYSGGGANETADAAMAELNAAVQIRDSADSAPLGDDAEEMVTELEQLQKNGRAYGVPTGFADLDDLTHGLHPGQMIIVAGRPAMGKSTLGVDFLRACTIKHNRPAVMFSLEMSRRDVQHRIMSAEARVGLHHIRGGSMSDSDWARYAEALPRFTSAPLTIDATPGQTVMQIKARSRKLKQRHGLDLIVIDYLQLLESGASRGRDNRQQEVSDMSRNVKLMALELEVPVVVLCQLNRGPEQRQDKRPMVSDLRESGSLEQDADIVILVHRDDAYNRESERAGEADLIVGKHRNGSPSTITVANQLHYSRFVDMAHT
jgi:replicative DNA helicase